MNWRIILVLLPAFFFQQAAVSAEQERKVVVTRVEGVINPVTSELIRRGIEKADGTGAEALVLELDTPGGLDSSMRTIVKDIIGSSVPVIVYVSPGGARAASAGVFIAMAAHVAAMAPGTNIGAAHPVGIGEKMDKTTSEKATNDAAAYIRTLAERSGRNAKWAENAVRRSISATEKEAVREGVIDIISGDLRSLLSEVDGRKVKTIKGERILKTAGAVVAREKIDLRHRVLAFITDPNVAYMLMLLGFYGLFFELTNPGAIFPGVAGGICLILAFYAFQMLPVNYAGLMLILLAIILFVLEVKIISHGVLTIGGLIAMVLGSLMLFESPGPFMKLSLYLIVPAVVVTAFFFSVVVGLAFRAQRRKPVSGAEGLVGTKGVAMTDVTSEGGMVSLHGELWSSFSEHPIAKGQKVLVEGVSGLRLKVGKTE